VALHEFFPEEFGRLRDDGADAVTDPPVEEPAG